MNQEFSLVALALFVLLERNIQRQRHKINPPTPSHPLSHIATVEIMRIFQTGYSADALNPRPLMTSYNIYELP